jgi:glutaredoxin
MEKRRHQGSARRGRQMLPGLLLLAALPAHVPAVAQVYKWTDAQGTVHYGDTPPPQRAASRLDAPSSDESQAAPLPYELARAVKASPVTLYTTVLSACAACDQGRALLRARGIPYTEKTVNTDEDKEQLRQLTGKLELPVLAVGKRTITGFEDAAWQDALSAAAYPRSTQLPPGYQFAPAQTAAPAPAGVPVPPAREKNAAAPDAAAARAAEQQPRRPAARDTTPATRQPTGNAPPGFQF